MKYGLTTLLLLVMHFAWGQQLYTGYTSDNFNGYTSSYAQPAAIVNTVNKFAISGSFINLGSSNYIGRNTSNLSLAFGNQQEKYREPFNKGYNFNAFALELLSGYYEINHKNSIGYAFRTRFFANLDGLNVAWTAAKFNDYDSTTIVSTPLSYTGYGRQQFVFNEHRFNYGRVIFDQRDRFLKAGVALKILNGIDATYMFSEQGTMNFDPVATSSANFSGAKFEYGSAEKKTSLNTGYAGLGFDIGAEFEYRPNPKQYRYEMDGKKNIERYDKKKYLFKIGASITDIGRVKFRKDTNSFDFTATANQMSAAKLADLGFNVDLNNPQLFTTFDLEAQLGQKIAEQSPTFRMNLPTLFNLQFDYNFWKSFYANYTSSIPLKLRNDPSKVHLKALHTLTVRYESPKFGVMVPFSMQRNGKLNMGLAGRYLIEKWNLGLFLGTNNIMGYLGQRAKFTNNVYGGATFNFAYKVPVDTDGDLISDPFDECPFDFGLAELNGCPDTDRDGIPDKEDHCIYMAGPKKTNGCPDTDGDGVIDLNDQCPEEPGLAIHYGCPDRDKDGVIDAADRCPDVPGVELNNGCPMENPGCCMDNDGDGVSNNVDECPDVAGSVYNKGCPIDEKNIDRINLQEQKEKLDPNHTNQKKEELKKVEKIDSFKEAQRIEKLEKKEYDDKLNIYFKSDDATVERIYDEQIREFAKKYDFGRDGKYKVVIAGHTDNDGSTDYNLILSKKRAEVVRRKLEGAGVDYDQVEIYYYGELKPMLSNNNEENKRLNRRVEVRVYKLE